MRGLSRKVRESISQVENQELRQILEVWRRKDVFPQGSVS